jgi:3-oxoadipate enol-lactonase
MPPVDVNGISINYVLDGSGSNGLVVLVNGLADSLQTWDLQVPALLKAGYRVLRYDNRGIGASSRPPGPYTAEMMANDLHQLLKHPDLDVKTFHLLGVSMGGMIAQSYALKYPNGSAAAQGLEMLSLSLCCTYAQPTEFCSRMFDLWADMAQRMSVQDVMRDVTLWAFTVPFFRQRTAELEEVENDMKGLDMSTDTYLSQLNVIQKFDTTGELEMLRMSGKGLGGLEAQKVLVLAGKTDILIPVVLSRELSEKVEGSQFLTVKGGHACMWEFPDDFNKTIVQFLDQHKESKT